MAKFQMNVGLTGDSSNITARVGNGAGTANPLTKADNNKLLKLVGDSQYGLCAQGDQIEAAGTAIDESAPQDGFNMGSLQQEGRLQVTFDGLQATAGTGTISVGDYVVCGTVVALGTALSGPPKVCKATDAGNTLNFKWRVISILTGSGDVGSTGVIEAL